MDPRVVAVARSSTGNQDADSFGDAELEMGPPRPLKKWPVITSLKDGNIRWQMFFFYGRSEKKREKKIREKRSLSVVFQCHHPRPFRKGPVIINLKCGKIRWPFSLSALRTQRER